MLNHVVLIGRLVRDPELQYTSGSATPWCKFTLAVDRPYTDRETGDRAADFIAITAWRRLAETCAKYLAQGGQAAVVGRIKTRSYDDNQGVRRKAWEVEADDVRFLQRAKDNGAAAADNENADREIPFKI